MFMSPAPLKDLAPERLAALEGLAFDVDDTLTSHGKLTPAAYAALGALVEAGVALVAVTGRPLGFAEVWFGQWPLVGAVGENGAGYFWRQLADTALTVSKGEPPSFTVSGVHSAAALDVHGADGWATRRTQLMDEALARFPGLALTRDSWARRIDIAFDIGEFVHVPLSEQAALSQWLQDQGLEVVTSSIHLHGQPPGAGGPFNKATGFIHWHEAAQGRPVSWDRWAFIGDSPNDAAAFAAFPLSVGVANVAACLPKLPQAPAFITEAEAGAGFCELAAAILTAKGRG